METYSNEANHPYSGYRGAATAQPLATPNGFQTSSSESYRQPSEGGYQRQEQFYGSQQYEYQQREFAPPAGHSSADDKISSGMRASRAGWLCYLGGWITGLIFLLLKKEDRFVRFHAMQSLIFFGALSIVAAMFSSIPFLSSIGNGLGFVGFICWIVLMIKAARGRYYKLPIAGDYAEKWADSWRG